jgi:cystathionine beta-lyase
LEIARWLKARPDVERVLHPAFPDCPGHEYWQRDFKGSSGLFSVVLREGGKAQASAIVDRLEHFGIGYSWGGFESLATPVHAHRTVRKDLNGRAIIRLQIGLEDPADLIADLDRALSA